MPEYHLFPPCVVNRLHGLFFGKDSVGIPHSSIYFLHMALLHRGNFMLQFISFHTFQSILGNFIILFTARTVARADEQIIGFHIR